jgi:hypothetical protein
VRTRPGAFILLCLAACRQPPPAAAPALSPFQIEEPVTATIAAALAADGRGERADSLWDPTATIIADGEIRVDVPRFAGVGSGGEVAITESRLDLRQTLAWVYLEYRWSQLNAGVVREGRATVLLTPAASGGWKIVHAHSSTAREQQEGDSEKGSTPSGSSLLAEPFPLNP